MEFAAAAQYFNRDPVLDGYTSAFLFNSQAAAFSDATSDGATNRRRVLVAAPDITLPARRVLNIYGVRWVVGDPTPDGFQGVVVRNHYNMKRVNDTFNLLTPSQALAAATGTVAYGHKEFFKVEPNQATDADYDLFWNVFLGPGEPIVVGTFLRDLAGTLYRVRATYINVEGLMEVQADQLDIGVANMTLAADTFDPVADTNTGSTTVVPTLRIDAIKFYRLRAQSDPAALLPGDMMFFVPNTATVAKAQNFTYAGERWRVFSVVPELDAFVLHARRG